MESSVWGKDQLGFYENGDIMECTGEKVALGVVNTSTQPSTVYVLGYDGQQQAVKNLIGKVGVTSKSVVIDNCSQKKLGNAEAFTELNMKDRKFDAEAANANQEVNDVKQSVSIDTSDMEQLSNEDVSAIAHNVSHKIHLKQDDEA